jgi:hypothetical protein
MVLDHRAITRNNRIYHQLLIKWVESPAEMATWEDEDDFLRRFLEFTAWGQAIANGGDDVTIRPIDRLPSFRRLRPKRNTRPNTRYAGPD